MVKRFDLACAACDYSAAFSKDEHEFGEYTYADEVIDPPVWDSKCKKQPPFGIYIVDDPRRVGYDLMIVDGDGIGGANDEQRGSWDDYWCPGMRIAPVPQPREPQS